MAQLCSSNMISMKSKGDSNGVVWSSELDHIPLIQRRKLILSRKMHSASGGSNSEVATKQIKTQPNNEVIKNEDDQCYSQGLISFPSASLAGERIDQQLVQQQSLETKVSFGVASVAAYDKIRVDSGSGGQHSQNAICFRDLGVAGDCNCEEMKANTNICSEEVPCLAVDGVDSVNASVCPSLQNPVVLKKPAEIKIECSDNLHTSLGNCTSDSANSAVQDLKLNRGTSNDCANDLDYIVLKERQRMLRSRKLYSLAKPFLEGIPMALNSSEILDNEPESTNSMPSSTLLNLVEVKAEPLEIGESHNPDGIAMSNFFIHASQEKSEMEIPNVLYGDNIDHMQLRDRMKLQETGEDSKLKISGNFKCLKKVVPSIVDYNSPTVSETSSPVKIICPRKRKKTATDSVEKALEEDAPGLLQVLMEQGVSFNEMKLYGEPESDELIDESFIEDGFADLEAVMFKLFFQRNSLLKLAPIRCAKGSKPSYCLACLFSLVEQTRYLHFRNWPAEWGWCRDLQSFIFVFERHNRIVLERPEYGYATYFFELVDSSPIDWQIKRLVTAMKLTSCGRVTLIENKPLLVGEDLTEGEAQVLIQHGWIPNSGLGTMLNYRDRVVHDRKNEDSSEWRSKIGKLLADGYNGGSIVSTDIQTKDIEDERDEKPQINTKQ